MDMYRRRGSAVQQKYFGGSKQEIAESENTLSVVRFEVDGCADEKSEPQRELAETSVANTVENPGR